MRGATECGVGFVCFFDTIRAELRETIYIFALGNHSGEVSSGYNTCKYLLKSWVQFVRQLTRARSVSQISVNLKLPQYSNPGSLSICLCLLTESACMRSVQVGHLFVHTGQWASSIPTLVLYHLVCFHGL